MSKLKFGDLAAKAAAHSCAKECEKFERKIYIATECLKRCKTLPPPEASIRDYPPVIQRLGIDACREAAQRLRQKAAL